MSNYTGDRRRISVRVVDSLKPGSIVWDTVLAGFAVRCQRRDKVYVLKYRAGLRQRWYTIGRHGMPWAPETARREARRLLGDIAAGRDPALLRTVSTTDTTVAALVTKFVNEYTAAKTKPRTAAEYKRLLAKLLPPEFRTRQIVDVTRADIERLHHGLRNTPYQANRVLAVLSRMFALAEGWGLRHDGSNPCRHVQKYRERRRDRFLSAEELARLGIALTAAGKDGEPPAAIAAIRLLALTGCRKSEVLRLRWSQVEPNCLRLSDSKTGAKVVPLGAAARELLASLPSWEGNPYVIVGDRPNSHFIGIQKVWERIRRQAGLDDVRIHDLRHSFASVGASSGDSLLVIGALLGHRDHGTTQRYAHLSDDPLQAAADRISAHIATALERGQLLETDKSTGT